MLSWFLANTTNRVTGNFFHKMKKFSVLNTSFIVASYLLHPIISYANFKVVIETSLSRVTQNKLKE